MSAKNKRRLAKLETVTAATEDNDPMSICYVIEHAPDMTPDEATKKLGVKLRPQDWVLTLEILPPGSAPRFEENP
jgi:hypothetical protein